MNNYSMTIAGILAMVLGAIAKQLNRQLPASEQDIANAITTVIQVLGLLLAYIGRVRQGDITWYGARKSS
jgi:hydrogenase/urease accessory protein HupE